MRGHLLLTNCIQDEVTRPNIELALKEDKLLWLDLQDTDDETLALLREVFKLHPLAIEDAKEFHQRPKVEDYDDFVSLVVYGARGLDEPLTEVHCFYAEHFLVSVHRDEMPAIADACHTLGRLPTDRRLVALYRLLDTLVDTMFPYLAAMDDRIDDLQDQIFESPKEEQLAAVFALKRQVVDMRKMVTPQRDMVASMLTQVIPIPGMTAESERYVRDLYDHLIRISDLVDSLPRPAQRLARRVHVDGVQPAQRRDEAADDHRHRVPAAVVPDRVLRPELRLAGDSVGFPGRLPCPGHRHRSPRGRRPGHAVPHPGLDGQGQKILKTFMTERAEVRALAARGSPLGPGRIGTASLACGSSIPAAEGAVRDGVVTGSRCRASAA